jgi:hypothetical protein
MLTASKLSKLSVKVKELDTIIKEHLFIIDDKMLKSDKTWGRNVISHELPTVFIMSSIDRKDAQRLIYSAILKNLEKRGFEARILLEDNKTVLYIAWIGEHSKEDFDEMNNTIIQHRIAPNQIEHFVNKKN